MGHYAYSLRFGAGNRVRHFTDQQLVVSAVSQIQHTCQEEGFSLLAYCFMPDHVHLVVEGQTQASDLRRFVKIAKQRVAYVARTQFAVSDIWQDGYYERVVRSHEQIDRVIRYVLENPVKAKLVERAEDYLFSWALDRPEAF